MTQKPDYSKYSMAELREALETIDQEKYPDVYNSLIKELSERKLQENTENVDEEIPLDLFSDNYIEPDWSNKQVFSIKSILSATFFGGPLAAGLLISQNYKVFNMPDAALKALFWGILSTILLFGMLILLPDPIVSKIPHQLIPFIYTSIIYLLVKDNQNKLIEGYLKKGAQKASGWKTAGYSILSLLIIAVFFFVTIFFIPPFEGNKMEFGWQKHQIYYDEEIDENEVSKLGTALLTYGYFASDEQQVVNLQLTDDTYRLLIYVSKAWWQDSDIIESLQYLESHLSNSVMSKKLVIVMIEDGFNGREEKLLPAAN